MERSRVSNAQPENSQLPTHELIREQNQSSMAMAAARRFVDRGGLGGLIVLDWEEWMSVPLEEPIEGHVECSGEVGRSGAA